MVAILSRPQLVKKVDAFGGDQIGGAVTQTSAQTICISVWMGLFTAMVQ